MEAKAWIMAGLAVFIIGAVIWLNIKNRKK